MAEQTKTEQTKTEQTKTEHAKRARTERPEAAQLKITQVKSKIGGNSAQRDTLRSLGLHRIGESVVRADRPEIRGMIRVVRHLVTVEEVH